MLTTGHELTFAVAMKLTILYCRLDIHSILFMLSAYLCVGATIILNDADGEYYVSHRDDPEGHPFRADDDDARFFAAYSDYHRGYSVTRGHIFQRGPNAIEGVC